MASIDGTALRIAICGGGASAVLLLNALRSQGQRPIAATVIEPREALGVGLAYSTVSPIHLLNTRACHMSATEDPNGFVNWLRSERRRRGFNWSGQDFAPRHYYGEYLQAQLKRIRSASHMKLSWLQSTADSILPCEEGWEVIPARGEPVQADVIVLATGNEAPRALGASLPPQAQDLVLEDPWDVLSKSQIPKDSAVLLAGTSLTAVDIAAELLHTGHTGPIYAFSRRGLLPRCHGPVEPLPEGFSWGLPATARELVKQVRELAASDPRGQRWRGLFTELRAIAPIIWKDWSLQERQRFLRHLRPFWDVHRHRIAPQVNSRITRAIDRGQLQILRARLENLEALPSGENLRVTLKNPHGRHTLEVSRLINCTGPEAHPLRSTNPLLQSLISDGIARADALGLGLATDVYSRVLGVQGAHATLYALASLARGHRWEVTSIPEIREQVNGVARHILQQAHGNHAGMRRVNITLSKAECQARWA